MVKLEDNYEQILSFLKWRVACVGRGELHISATQANGAESAHGRAGDGASFKPRSQPRIVKRASGDV